MHRLGFVREELQAVLEIQDIDLALQRLAYHMENYLVRIYELRERAAKLLKAATGFKGDIGSLKKRDDKKGDGREKVVRGLSSIDQAAGDLYLQLLDDLDEDICLRNKNTHCTFLSLGFCTGDDVYDPHDALLDLESQDSAALDSFKERLREEVENTVRRYDDKIQDIVGLTHGLLEQLDFVSRHPRTRS